MMTELSPRVLANAIRALAMDAVQKANSGHPGAPMGMADIAEVLWRRVLKHNPVNPNWSNRDRFVLSNGHGSMLQYALLHLTGYALSIEDIQEFRQLHSKTPGHPEYGYTPGVQTTTGPLGQGIANAVGFAIAEKTLAAQFNREELAIIDHYTYCFLGDGCLMEGISHEVCSLAGTLKLGKLIAFYDDNGISIDGEVEGWFSDDTVRRFEAYGWQVIRVDGHDAEQIMAAIVTAQQNGQQPTLICCKTIIGFGSPNKQGTESSHGAALGQDEIILTRQNLGWEFAPFEIPENIYAAWDGRAKGEQAQAQWEVLFAQYQERYPQLAAEFTRRQKRSLPPSLQASLRAYVTACAQKSETIATRKASQHVLEVVGAQLPELLGGSADLAGSNLTLWSGCRGIQDHADGNYIYYGVREFGMTAIANGIALYGGFIPYVATFLVFMEYARNAVRMSALMKLPVIHVYTHDSIGLGEDGPTHQPIEQIASLRQTPNLHAWRPCDTVETAVAWQCALERSDGPSALILSRQNLPCQLRDDTQIQGIYQGGYILAKEQGDLKAIILATGSEVAIAMEAYAQLSGVRVVSMPCCEIFAAQPKAYRDQVLPPALSVRVAIEAAHCDYWYKWTGLHGRIIGMQSFGESAPAVQLYDHFNITTAAVVNAIHDLCDNSV